VKYVSAVFLRRRIWFHDLVVVHVSIFCINSLWFSIKEVDFTAPDKSFVGVISVALYVTRLDCCFNLRLNTTSTKSMRSHRQSYSSPPEFDSKTVDHATSITEWTLYLDLLGYPVRMIDGVSFVTQWATNPTGDTPSLTVLKTQNKFPINIYL